LLLVDRSRIDAVTEFVIQGNTAQMRDAAFVRELEQWIRFGEREALDARDGLFARSTGNPAMPRWLGSTMFRWLFTEKAENDRYAKQMRSSAGVAVFVARSARPAHWIEVGRAYQRFALLATSLGVRNAFVNPPVEVPALREQFAQWLGMEDARPNLVVRFGRGPLMPPSLRRPIDAVIGGPRALQAATGAARALA
ncbi:MAG: Tat pathway signal protein, partial [Burkholderiaceae bacterium]|nr:Tat pathway signal protein [Burkholderiaceae bacterium]